MADVPDRTGDAFEQDAIVSVGRLIELVLTKGVGALVLLSFSEMSKVTNATIVVLTKSLLLASATRLVDSQPAAFVTRNVAVVLDLIGSPPGGRAPPAGATALLLQAGPRGSAHAFTGRATSRRPGFYKQGFVASPLLLQAGPCRTQLAPGRDRSSFNSRFS